ncbi:DUF1028 domain-containing protein [Desertimonas flava]|uniref:DUF1028 domain-containing protein n=1 Tax=Desertimonas flava TaxID=2064846 RepID=UPI000E34BC6A|nr:DUF1028 domain-containing protein [Desertimonas flava]
MTYSIVARDPSTGELGVAVQSHFFAAGSVVPFAEAGVGAIATQSIVDLSYGVAGLRRLASGDGPADALAAVQDADDGRERRQVAIVSAAGEVAAYTGTACIAAAGHVAGDGFSVQANLVTSPAVWEAMATAFAATSSEPLVRRLLAALDAAQAAGGDLRGQQSAAVKIVRGATGLPLGQQTVLDLRVDDHPQPLVELRRLVDTQAAFGGLIDLLNAEGLLVGEPTADAGAVADAVHVLSSAQRWFGTANVEPSVWLGVLYARFGHDDLARSTFAFAGAHLPSLNQLVRALGDAGSWPFDALDLARLLPG